MDLYPLVVVVGDGVDRLLDASEISGAARVDDDGLRDGRSSSRYRHVQRRRQDGDEEEEEEQTLHFEHRRSERERERAKRTSLVYSEGGRRHMYTKPYKAYMI